MGFWDDEEKEEIDQDILGSGKDEDIGKEENSYLADAGRALGLIAKIISVSSENYWEKQRIQKIDTLMDREFLGNLKKISLNNEAQLQVKLSGLSDKLIEEKNYQVLSNKTIIGIGGKFSAGKSKFINSFLNAREGLLPEAQNPTTSIPTYLVYGKEEKICAYTMDNREILLEEEAMQALTHEFFERYRIGFSSFIYSMIITEPDMPYRNLVFLDTPGYNKADTSSSHSQKKKTDEEKAYEQLKGVDFLIWLLDIENGGLSQKDIAFIQRLNMITPILIVANKSDKKADCDKKEIIKRIELDAKEFGIPCFAVTAYSSEQKSEWGNGRKIAQFLNYAQKHPQNKETIYQQICEINKEISKEIAGTIRNEQKERNKLTDIIFQSDDIMEIKTLIDIYGETMEKIREMKQCQSAYLKIARNLKKSLGRQFERK